jgi:uncharacterized protein (TIGR01244 family)
MYGVTKVRLLITAAVIATCAVSGGAGLASQAPAAASPQEFPPIRNFLQVNPQFCTGGQPRLEHFAKLKADGVKAVLNLRTPGEHRAAEEQAAVEKAGMKYFNIPVVYTAPTDAQVDEFLRITDDPANRPMFIHCTAAIRVGGFWMIRRALRDGLSADAALEDARKVGLIGAPHLEEFARSYIASHKR